MQQSRPLMDVNEDSEILFRLGILTSKAKSKSRLGKAESTGEKAGPSFASGSSITDDEDSDLDILYDKRSLLSSESRPRGDVKCAKLSPRRVLPSLSFIALGLLTSILLVTLPDIRAATKTANAISILHVLLFNGLGYLFGSVLLSRLFNRCNPLMLLMLCTACSIPFTLIIAWCSALQFVHFYSCILGAFLGSLHQGGLMIIGGNGFGIRTLLFLHACLAFGLMLAPIAGALFINGPMSQPFIFVEPTESSSSTSAIETHKVVRRAIALQRDADSVQQASSSNVTSVDAANVTEATTAAKPKKPDQAMGIQDNVDPKSKENQAKRNREDTRTKNTEAPSVVVSKNCTGNARGCDNATTVGVQPSLGTTSSNTVNVSTNLQSSTATTASETPVKPVVLQSSGVNTVTTTVTETGSQKVPPTTVPISPKASPASSSSRTAELKTLTPKATPVRVEPALKEKLGLSTDFNKRRTKEDNQMENATWEKVSQQIAELNGVKLAYGLVGLLSFACIIPFMFSFLCCCEQVPGAASLRVAELHPGEVSPVNGQSRTPSLWQWLAKFFFLLVSGTEITFGVLVAACAYDIFNDSEAQLKGFFVTSTFWAGVLLSRLTFSISSRVASSVRLMQFLLLVTSVVSCFVAVFSHATAIPLGVEVFLIGCFLAPVMPCVLGWLDMQKAIDWSALSLSYSASVSVGRAIVPYFAFLLISRYSSFKAFFIYVSILLTAAFLILLILTRSVRNVARVIAVEQLSKTLMNSEKDEKKEMRPSKDTSRKTMKGGYIKLMNKDEDPELEIIASDEEYEDEL